jgi:hypothetical protein
VRVLGARAEVGQQGWTEGCYAGDATVAPRRGGEMSRLSGLKMVFERC